MERFYFTYGQSETMPFKGGWTEVIAPDIQIAEDIFRAFHPDNSEGFLNCSTVYREELFKRTSMCKNGNFGAYCHEIIEVRRELK